MKNTNDQFGPRNKRRPSMHNIARSANLFGFALQGAEKQYYAQEYASIPKPKRDEYSESRRAFGERVLKIQEAKDKVTDNIFAKTFDYLLLRTNPGAYVGKWISDKLTSPEVLNTAKGYIDVARHRYAGQPDGYDPTDLFKDQWNLRFAEMNKNQADEAVGYQVRAENDKRLIGSYQESLDILDLLDLVNGAIQELTNRRLSLTDANLIEKNEIDLAQLKETKKQLSSRYQSLARDRKLLEDTVNLNNIFATWDAMIQGKNMFGNIGFIGKSTALHDELNDARLPLWDLNINGDRNVTRKKLNDALLRYDSLNDDWNAVIKDNEADEKYHRDKITSWFSNIEKNTHINLSDPDTYIFKMPGINGGSGSSWHKQWTGTIIGLLGNAAAAYLSGGSSLAASAAAGGGSFAFNRASGVSENNIEVAQSAIEVIKSKTGLSEDQIKKVLSGKDKDPKKLRKIRENVKDVENLFRKDMAATTWDSAIDAALTAVPVGSAAKFGKYVAGTKAFEAIKANPRVAKILESKGISTFANDFKSGFEAASAGGVGVGALGGITNATIGRGAKKVGGLVYDAVKGSKAGTLAKKLSTKIKETTKRFYTANPDKIKIAKDVQRGTLHKYMYGMGRRLVYSGISEGIEEAKQHINAEKFKNGELGLDYMNIFEIAFDDTINGLTSGAYMLGIPLDASGIISIKDQDLLEEIKGGMLGGLFHTGSVAVVSNVAPYIRERKADELVVELILRDKLEHTFDYLQYQKMLKRGFFSPNLNDVNESFQRVKDLNEKHKNENGEYAIDPSLIDEHRRKYNRLLSIANDPFIIKAAEAQGIYKNRWNRTKAKIKERIGDVKDDLFYKENIDEPSDVIEGRDEFNKFVSALAVMHDKRDAHRDLYNQAMKEEDAVRNEIRAKYSPILGEHDENDMIDPADFLITEKSKSPETIADYIVTSNEESETLSKMVQNIAELAAMLEYRNQLETVMATPLAKTARRGLQKQLDTVNEHIEKWTEVCEHIANAHGIEVGKSDKNEPIVIREKDEHKIRTLEDLENNLVFDEESHQKLKTAFLDRLKWESQIESDDEDIKAFVGTPSEEITPYSNPKDITYSGGRGSVTIWKAELAMNADDEFILALEIAEELYDLEDTHLADEDGWGSKELMKVKPDTRVLDKSGKQIRVSFTSIDGNIIPDRLIAENEYVDEMGYLWRRSQWGNGAQVPVVENQNALQDAVKNAIFAAFKHAFDNDPNNSENGVVLPYSPAAFHEACIRARMVKLANQKLEPFDGLVTNKSTLNKKGEETIVFYSYTTNKSGKVVIDNNGGVPVQSNVLANNEENALIATRINGAHSPVRITTLRKRNGKWYADMIIDGDKIKKVLINSEMIPAIINTTQIHRNEPINTTKEEKPVKEETQKLKLEEPKKEEEPKKSEQKVEIVKPEAIPENKIPLISADDAEPSAPIVPPTPPVNATVIVPDDDDKNPQDSMMRWLEERSQNDKRYVSNNDRYHTTSYDYFVEDPETLSIVRASRVHSVKPTSYTRDEIRQKIYDDAIVELNNLSTLDLIKQWIDKTKVRFENTGINVNDLDVYYNYLSDNLDIIYGESKKELKAVYNSMASIISDKPAGISPQVGNALDELSRAFYDISSKYYELTATEEGIRRIFNTVCKAFSTDKLTVTFGNVFGNNYELFKNLINQMRDRYDLYVNQLGWKLSTLPITWYHNFLDTVGWVAGQTDMIGVDRNGNLHIIDFKTSRYSFGDVAVADMLLQAKYGQKISVLTADDFKNGTGNRRVRAILREIKNDSGNKNITIRLGNDGRPHIYSIKFRPFYETPKKGFGQILSDYQSYSDLQTSYAELVANETSGLVASTEIMGYYLDYDYSHFAGITKIQLHQRIRLGRSKEMLQILYKNLNFVNECLSEDVANAEAVYKEVLTQLETGDTLFGFLRAKLEQVANNLHNIIGTAKNVADNLNTVYSSSDVQNILSELLYHVDEANSALDDVVQYLDSLNDNYIDEQEYRQYMLSVMPTYDYDDSGNYIDLAQNTEQAQNNLSIVQPPAPPVVSSQPQEQQSIPQEYMKNKRSKVAPGGLVRLFYKDVEANPELERATIAPDFITDSTFVLRSNGSMVYCDIYYHEKVYTVHMINPEIRHKNSIENNFINRVQALERLLKPGERIVATAVDRTSGRGKQRADGKYHNAYTNTDLFAGEDIYEIEFSREYGRIGFVDGSGTIRTFDKSDTARVPIFSYTNAKDVPAEGTLLVIQELRQNEYSPDSPEAYAKIPIAVTKRPLSTEPGGDVDFIINALLDPLNLDRPHYVQIGTNMVSVGATKRQLINLMMPVVDSMELLVSNMKCIVRNQDGTLWIGNATDRAANGGINIDISTDGGINKLRELLSSRIIQERHDVLLSRLGSSESNPLLPFNGIKQFFAQNGAKVKQLLICPSLVFDIEDFKKHTASNGAVYSGLSGFGWYLKHGIILTLYTEMGHSNVRILDYGIRQAPTTPLELEVTNATGIPENIADIDYSDDGPMLFKTTKDLKKTRPVDKEKVEEFFKKVFGKDFKSQFSLDFVTGVVAVSRENNAAAIGACCADSIILSETYSVPGIEYHEAFHRIFELLIPENRRLKILQRIAKRLGISLTNEDGSQNIESYRMVSEYLADLYMDYNLEEESLQEMSFLQKLFHYIKNIVTYIRRLMSRDIYRLFREANSGAFAGVVADEKLKERFKNTYGSLHATIHGVDFDNILDTAMYDSIKDTAKMCIIMGLYVESTGRNIESIGRHIDKDTLKKGIDLLLKRGIDLIGQNAGENLTVSQKAFREYYEKFHKDNMRDDMATALSIMTTDFETIDNEESEENKNAGEVEGSDIGDHTRSSYEFSRFSKTSAKVKYFFATIPDQEPVVITQNGENKVVYRYVLDEYGLPHYVPVHEMFSELLSAVHDVDSLPELKDRLSALAKQNVRFNVILNKILDAEKKAYKVENDVVVRDSYYESVLSLILNQIRAHRHSFNVVQSKVSKLDDGLGKNNLMLQRTDASYNMRHYVNRWNQILVVGGTPILKVDIDGTLIFNKQLSGSDKFFNQISYMLDHQDAPKKDQSGVEKVDVGMKQWIMNAISTAPAKNFVFRMMWNKKVVELNDPNNQQQVDMLKIKFCELLNFMGITFSKHELDYMLIHKYASSGIDALAQMFSSTAVEDSMTSFIWFLNNVRTPDGKVNNKYRISGGRPVDISKAFEKIAFINNLGKWKYAYVHAHDELSVLFGDKQMYEMSDNNFIYDVTRLLNKRSKLFEDYKNDPYIYYVGEEDALGYLPVYGSFVMKELSKENSDAVISVHDYNGFRTDRKSDYGQDYFQIQKREDYVSKAKILSEGYITTLTLADKKAFFYLTGVKLPGLNYNQISKQDGVEKYEILGGLPIVLTRDSQVSLEDMLEQNEDIVNLMISYAYSEYISAKKALRDIEEMEREETLSDEISNFYSKKQGARLHSLLGVWEYEYAQDGAGNTVVVGEKYVSFNDKKNGRTEADNLRTAELHFFNKPRSVQQALILRLLHKQFLRQVLVCEELGLIEKINDGPSIFYNYRNVGLDRSRIEAIYNALVATYGAPQNPQSENNYKSLATMIYINDISNRAIMSGHECERLFYGNPSFYKWTYDDDGNLVDRTVDLIKRIGGGNSTGNNNFLDLRDVPAKYLDEKGNFTGEYVCAQVGDELVESPLIAQLETLMYNGELSTTALITTEDKLVEKVNRKYYSALSKLAKNRYDRSELTENELDLIDHIDVHVLNAREEAASLVDSSTIQQLEELVGDKLDVIKRKSKNATDSFRLKYKKDGSIDDGINVADGSAYISDVMAEMLLRMCGNYGPDVLKAFELLRSETPQNVMEQSRAYNLIMSNVIVSQKYVAFGRRVHPKTGTLILFFNKMALFPMFRSISTGKLANIFDKMLKQGIDMLMFDSAVKVGGSGSRSVNWDSFRQNADETDPINYVNGEVKEGNLKPSFDDFKFVTYKQPFLFLRKQMNTDPKDESLMSIKTQMMKVVMANLFDGRQYHKVDGGVVSGKELRDDMMACLNILSNMGRKNIVRRFFKINKDGNPVDKYGNEVSLDSTEKVLDYEKFSKEMLKLLDTKDPDKNIVEALQLEKKIVDGVEVVTTSLPMDAVSNSKWLESILISTVNKQVVDVNTPGGSFIQRSVWGMEGTAMFSRDNGGIIGDENMSPTINGGKRLLMINEEGSMDCVVSVDVFKKAFGGEFPKVPVKKTVVRKGADGKEIKERKVVWDLIPEKDNYGRDKVDEKGNKIYKTEKNKDGSVKVGKDGKPIYKRKIRMREMTFEELRNWLKNRGLIGEGAKASIVGYRVPTLAESSIHALRVVDIINTVNDTVILPQEFTKITGSDFDIDKLYLSFLRYNIKYVEEDGKYHQTINTNFDESGPAYYTNKLINDYITLLLDWNNGFDKTTRTANILHRSIDNDTELPLKVIEELYGKQSSVELPYLFYALDTLTDVKDKYITGKIGIGPYALNNNGHILAMMYHLKFKHINGSLMDRLDLERLDRRLDGDNESVLSWISALINGHVDIAKDPWVVKLNVNPFTYNISNLLIRTGFGKRTFYFTCQPIIKAMAKAYTIASARYMSDPKKGRYDTMNDAVELVANSWFEDVTIGGIQFSQALDVIQNGTGGNKSLIMIRDSVNEAIVDFIKSDLFKAEAKNGAEYDIQHQALVYLAYIQFSKYASQLSNLINYTKVDTKKHGKSLSELFVYKQGYEKLFDVTDPTNLFDPESLSRLKEHSYIAVKTANAIDTVVDILGHQFIESSSAFIHARSEILNRIGRSESLSVELVDKVTDALSAAVKSKFFNEEYVPSILKEGQTVGRFMHDLVSDSYDQADFYIKERGNAIKVNPALLQHPIESYIGGKILLKWKDVNGNYLKVDPNNSRFISEYTVIAADPSTNTIYIDNSNKLPSMQGSAILKGGKNSMYDRLNRLVVNISCNPKYANLKSGNGDPKNRLLQMLVPGNTYEYITTGVRHERPDTYENSRFVKLFNFIENSGTSSNYIIDAWDELLNYVDQNEDVLQEVREFARDLIVYAFMTSGDKAGFTKMFKYTPFSWRKTSGYGDFISRKLVEYNQSSELDINLDDVILNNWFDYEMCPTMQLKDDQKVSNFVQYFSNVNGIPTGYATMLAAIKKSKDGGYTPSIDPLNAPKFIKISRYAKNGLRDSQRNYTVYKLYGLAENSKGLVFPVYVKVNPKGNNTAAGFLITEYGRSDAVWPQEYEIKEELVTEAVNTDHFVPTHNATFDFIIQSLARSKQNGLLMRDPDNSESASKLKDHLEKVAEQTAKEAAESLEVDSGSTTSDQDRFNTEEENLEVLNSEKTILSNEELAIWNKAGVGKYPRILSASEHSDPAFHAKKIINIVNGTEFVYTKKKVEISKEEYDSLPKEDRYMKWQPGGNHIYYKFVQGNPLSGKDFAGLYLITKHDGLPMKELLELKIPKLIHFSITSLGSTAWEPGVMKYNDLLDRIQEYIQAGLDPDTVTIRIDPIVPGVTNFEDVETIIRRASEMGIKRIRFSVMLVYNGMLSFLQEQGYDVEKYYPKEQLDLLRRYQLRDEDGDKQNCVHASRETIDDICDKLLALKDKYNITLGSCAEDTIRDGISKEGCLSVAAVNRMLGTSFEDKGTSNNFSRKMCSCFGGKFDVLNYRLDKCFSHCIYCYANHQQNKAVLYYDEDGNLRDNIYTRTFKQDVQKQQQGEIININTISDKTATFGVVLAKDSKDLWDKFKNGWLSGDKNKIIAYRKYGDKPQTFTALTVKEGWIGNPFSVDSKGEDTVLKFYEWLVTGYSFNEPRANKQFRDAIIDKILNSSEDDSILYYTELNRPSHATVIGYLIKNKHLFGYGLYKALSNNDNQVQQSNTSSTEFYSGAAPGSDSEWGKQARALGINVKDYTGIDYRSLSQEWIDKIEKEYIKSREFLGKPALPIRDINNDYDPGVLTRRDMMQADKADAIFAIAERIVKPGDVEMSKGRPYVNNTGHDNVAGGTANAVARGIIRGIPVYVFDQSDLQWKLWNLSGMRFEQTDEPNLTRHAATIGTRNIDDSGRKAISSVLHKFVGDNRTTTNTVNNDLQQDLLSPEDLAEAERIKKECKGE